jgi:hypothetical protein
LATSKTSGSGRDVPSDPNQSFKYETVARIVPILQALRAHPTVVNGVWIRRLYICMITCT